MLRVVAADATQRGGVRGMFRRATLVLTGIGMAVVLAAGTAAAGTGTVFYSPEQAGYAATGARFKVAEVRVKLPYASSFTRELGRVGFSVQLWSAATVLDLWVSACTDTSCRPGGTPVTRRYSVALRVFSRSTRALICTTSNSTCPFVPASWKDARFAPGRTVELSLFYDHNNGFVDAGVGIAGTNTGVDYLNYNPGAGVNFGQARIGAEFGPSPWSEISFRVPASETLLASFWVPANEAELATYSGSAGCFDMWWISDTVKMTKNGTSATAIEARPHGLSHGGCDFSVYLER